MRRSYLVWLVLPGTQGTLCVYVCICVCECQGLEEESLWLRSCHGGLSSGAHPAWQLHKHTYKHRHTLGPVPDRVEETPWLCGMNGCLLTLCVPHHDGLIMTELNCVSMDVCVCVCVYLNNWKGREKESDRLGDMKAFMCVHVWHVASLCMCVCVCGHVQGLLLFTWLLKCSSTYFLSVNSLYCK